MSQRPGKPALEALSPRTSSKPNRKPILPGPIARSARASALQPVNLTSASSSGSSTVSGINMNMNSTSNSNAELKGRGKSLFQSFRSLAPNARIIFGLVVGTVGIAGLLIDRNVLQDDKIEDKPPISVRMVDRK
ncbi:uncharacterized protein IL334_006487 [Kwoniella shivajii]|uniref:Cytochrome c oxidase assembly factor 3 n=1 Tax=Kwoniella shivajii TaxID=564305 RepID=A0ABZ1D956_9TREE|nr:hypothetical protein IL334_006487 [Kwoniella shivajii]